MQERKISHTQLTALVWAATLAPAVELLPTLTLPLAGKGAWLAPVAAIPLVLLAGFLMRSLAGEEGLAASLPNILGTVAGKGLLLIYIGWGEVLLTLRLRLCAQRLLSAGYRDGAMWFFLLSVAALVLWMGVGKLDAFARAGQIFLAVLLTTGGVVLLLSAGQVRPERVLPLWSQDVVPVLSCALPGAGALGWGMYGAFLAHQAAPGKSKSRWYGLFWGVGGCLLLALSQWIVLGNLGPALAARLDNPFLSLAKSIGVEGAFQRVESVIAALWTFSDLTLAALLVFALRTMVGVEVPKLKEQHTACLCLLLGVAVALLGCSDGMAERWNREIVPTVNLILGLAIPFFVWVVKGLCTKKKYQSTSCGTPPV